MTIRPAPSRPRRRRLIIGLSIAAAVVALCGCGIGTLAAIGNALPQPSRSAAGPASVVPVASSSPAPSPRPSVTVPSASTPVTADRKAAAAVLTANVAHFKAMFAQGRAIIGTTQYADAQAGNDAMADPKSAAARFRDYRQHPNPGADQSFQDAFTRADAHFTADNEPQAISDWRDDMVQVSVDFNAWIQVAVGYQIRTKSQADLDAAAATVTADLAKADQDLQGVLAG